MIRSIFRQGIKKIKNNAKGLLIHAENYDDKRNLVIFRNRIMMETEVSQVQASIQTVSSLVATAVSRYTDLVEDLITSSAELKIIDEKQQIAAQVAQSVSAPGMGENIDLIA